MGETYRQDGTGREFRVFGAELRPGADEDSERPEDLLIAMELQGGGVMSGASFFLPLDQFRRRYTAAHECFRDDCRCTHLAGQHRAVGHSVVWEMGPCQVEGCGCTAYQVWD